MIRPQFNNLRRAAAGLWIVSVLLPGAPILCVGATGHAEFEFEDPSCCLASPGTPVTGIVPASDDDCIDCADFLVVRESTPGRRNHAHLAPDHGIAIVLSVATDRADELIRAGRPTQPELPRLFHILLSSTVIQR